MLAPKDLQARFKAGAFKTREELDAFAAEATGTPGKELLKLLDFVTPKAAQADPQGHRARCAAFARLCEASGDKTLFAPLVKALKAADPLLRTAIGAALPKINSVGDHGELVTLLRSPDASLRAAAAKVIPSIASRALYDGLSAALREEGHPGRAEAMEALALFARHQAIPPLREVAASGAPDAAQALKWLADPRVAAKDPQGALAAIAAALDARSEAVAAQAVASFSALSSEEDWFELIAPRLDGSTPAVLKAGIEGLRRWSSPRAIGQLERRLRAGPQKMRLLVINVCEQIGTDPVLPPLVEALAHRQLAVRTRAGEVLSALSLSGKLDLARTVIWLLRSRDVNVRRMATDLLKTVKDPDGSFWPKLLGLLRDEDWWVRERVMDALIERGGVPLARFMVGFLGDASDVVRRFATRVLGRLRDPQALRALVKAAHEDPDWWVRESAIEAVAQIGDKRAVPYLAKLMKSDAPLRLAILAALADLQATEAAGEVAALLSDEDADVRLRALQTLAAFEAAQLSPQVAPLCSDADVGVRKLARELLARWNQAVTGGNLVAAQGLDELLVRLAVENGDDLILSPGRPPMMKRSGETVPLGESTLAAEQLSALLSALLTEAQREALRALRDVDLPHEVKAEGLRFRANVFQQAGGLSAVFRRIKGMLARLDTLGLPEVVKSFGTMKNGLVLVGGPTGSGKSTTLAALIDQINESSSRHIISLEDPIEVVHKPKRSLVNQREVGTHTHSFAAALRSTLRQDPNVILVGELRDLDTIAFTVTAAETGHLVFGTVHTVSAATTVDRLVSAFAPGQQDAVRAMLAESLRAVVCQHLVPRKDGGRALAVEVMLNSDAVANLIRQGKSYQLPSVIATAREAGMQLMDTDLMRLCKANVIAPEEAYLKATNKKDFEALLGESATPLPQLKVG